MRMALGAFGLVGLLVVAFIVMYGQAFYGGAVVKQSRPARDMAQQFSGRDEDGRNALEKLVLEPKSGGSQFKSLVVKSTTPGSRIDAYFGLRPGDEIIGTGDIEFRGIITDAESAEAQVLSAYQNQRKVIVMRGGQRLVLPPDPGSPPPAGASPAPAPAPANTGNPLQRQLEGITKPR